MHCDGHAPTRFPAPALPPDVRRGSALPSKGRLVGRLVPLVTKHCVLVLLRRYTLGIAPVPPVPTLVHQEDSEAV